MAALRIRRPLRHLACAVVGSLGVLALPVSGPTQAADRGAGPGHDSMFWVDPHNRAARQVQVWKQRGRDEDAAVLRRISERPMAEWIVEGPAAHERAADVTEAAARQGRVAILVPYGIPDRDCGLYSEGGVENAAEYRRWVRRIASAIGDRRTVVVLEPDAVAHVVEGCVDKKKTAERLRLLREAVKAFKKLPSTSVYLDAGNPGWIPEVKRLVGPLRAAGVERADGFALNVSNFHTTKATRRYGYRLSRALGGAHFVIDTSRNGNGPLPAGEKDEETWCNPPGRALGVPPTKATGDMRVDAYLWIKRPGESDGTCRGAPPAGRWWAEYALQLARGAAGPGAAG